jgi:hypothetical protein
MARTGEARSPEAFEAFVAWKQILSEDDNKKGKGKGKSGVGVIAWRLAAA